MDTGTAAAARPLPTRQHEKKPRSPADCDPCLPRQSSPPSRQGLGKAPASARSPAAAWPSRRVGGTTAPQLLPPLSSETIRRPLAHRDFAPRPKREKLLPQRLERRSPGGTRRCSCVCRWDRKRNRRVAVRTTEVGTLTPALLQTRRRREAGGGGLRVQLGVRTATHDAKLLESKDTGTPTPASKYTVDSHRAE